MSGTGLLAVSEPVMRASHRGLRGRAGCAPAPPFEGWCGKPASCLLRWWRRSSSCRQRTRRAIPSLRGHSRLSPDLALNKAEALAAAGVGGVLLFGVPDDKDKTGRAAADPAGPVAAALRGLREAGLPLVLIADVCLCEYTTHGHCGVLNGEQVDNDASPAGSGRGRRHLRRRRRGPGGAERHDGRPGGRAAGSAGRGGS